MNKWETITQCTSRHFSAGSIRQSPLTPDSTKKFSLQKIVHGAECIVLCSTEMHAMLNALQQVHKALCFVAQKMTICKRQKARLSRTPESSFFFPCGTHQSCPHQSRCWQMLALLTKAERQLLPPCAGSQPRQNCLIGQPASQVEDTELAHRSNPDRHKCQWPE